MCGTAGRGSFEIRVERRRSGGGGARTRGGMLGGDGKRMQRELMRMKMQMVIVGATIAMLLTSCDEIIKPEQEGRVLAACSPCLRQMERFKGRSGCGP